MPHFAFRRSPPHLHTFIPASTLPPPSPVRSAPSVPEPWALSSRAWAPKPPPYLHTHFLPPVPCQVRAVSARAMGSLLKGMGSEAFSDLVPWLMATLRSEAGSVERSGAAQVWGMGREV